MNDPVSLCGLEVLRIGFGTLYITTQRGFGPARNDAVAVLKEAAGLGVRVFDTADSYGTGAAEQTVFEALHPYDGLIIATKGGFRHERLGAWVPDGRPEHLRAALEGSLQRLRVETIELYQLHFPDSRVPYSDSMGTLADLQAEGKIRHIGVSNVGLDQLEMARREASIVSVQNPYNIRRPWNDPVLGFCEAQAIVYIPWMPLGRSRLPHFWTVPRSSCRSLAPAQSPTCAKTSPRVHLNSTPMISLTYGPTTPNAVELIGVKRGPAWHPALGQPM